MPLVAYTQVHTGTVGEGVHSACGVHTATTSLTACTLVRTGTEGGGGDRMGREGTLHAVCCWGRMRVLGYHTQCRISGGAHGT